MIRYLKHIVRIILIFALIMWGVYYIAVSSLGSILTDWTNDTLFGEIIGENVATFLENVGIAPWLQGLINDGIIGGVGAVLGFVPQIMLLFFLLLGVFLFGLFLLSIFILLYFSNIII